MNFGSYARCKVRHFMGCRGVHYVQGQSPEPKIREYFYYVDHQGQLFLDDARMKNFTSCFKEKQFLKFFFSRVERNNSGRYTVEFPYISYCGPERNFVRCDDVPVVFTEIVPIATSSASQVQEVSQSLIDSRKLTDCLLYAGGTMSVPFEPQKVVMVPETGRVYHTGPANAGGVGLIKSSLAIELSKFFEFADNSFAPTHLMWHGEKYQLTNEVISRLDVL